MRDVGSLADLLPEVAADRPDQTALIFADGRLTWAELDAAVERVSAALRATGLGPGDRVAISLGSTSDFVIALHGVLRAGLVAVPTDPEYTERELAHVLADSGASVLITRDQALTGVRELRSELPTLAYTWVVADRADGPVDLDPSVGEAAFPEPFPTASGSTASSSTASKSATGTTLDGPGSGEDLAVLVYTSGTTGLPRGAMLSHRALLADLDHVSRIDPPVVTPSDVVLLAVPLFHIYGLNSGLNMAMRHGATAVLVERFEPTATLSLVREHGVTAVIAVPQMYFAWSMEPQIDTSFDSVRMAVSGSAPLAPAVLRRILDSTGKHVFEGYGLTETGPTVASTLMSEVPKAGSIGRPVPGVRVRLLEPTGEPDAAQVEADDAGEIAVFGENLFSGYWPDGTDGPDSSGWWSTGDLAYADADGDLHLVDRRRELIVVSGFHVYPREVEQVLIEHPDVLDAAIVGMPHPYTGQTVRAFVVRRPGSQLTEAELIAWAARQLARFKCPTTIEFVAELPYTALGKLRRAALREADTT
jgi:long-chain acyl-CoA synthetase